MYLSYHSTLALHARASNPRPLGRVTGSGLGNHGDDASESTQVSVRHCLECDRPDDTYFGQSEIRVDQLDEEGQLDPNKPPAKRKRGPGRRSPPSRQCSIRPLRVRRWLPQRFGGGREGPEICSLCKAPGSRQSRIAEIHRQKSEVLPNSLDILLVNFISKKQKSLTTGSTTQSAPIVTVDDLDNFSEGIINNIASALYLKKGLFIHEEVDVKSEGFAGPYCSRKLWDSKPQNTQKHLLNPYTLEVNADLSHLGSTHACLFETCHGFNNI